MRRWAKFWAGLGEATITRASPGWGPSTLRLGATVRVGNPSPVAPSGPGFRPQRADPSSRSQGGGENAGGSEARKRRGKGAAAAAAAAMASGWGITGNKGRCYDFWNDFSECMSRCREPKDCALLREDYLECLHHSKEGLGSLRNAGEGMSELHLFAAQGIGRMWPAARADFSAMEGLGAVVMTMVSISFSLFSVFWLSIDSAELPKLLGLFISGRVSAKSFVESSLILTPLAICSNGEIEFIKRNNAKSEQLLGNPKRKLKVDKPLIINVSISFGFP
ncbi:hypothetical protein Taro_027019 [Colocasia esculenta]|uniref:Uncharacterized protein n=1 Tax=Colocasia esculenta TaxID=4460 RepID=A0A843VGW6_COLES|nr:hypothetical protein [Colocasia esculenta]